MTSLRANAILAGLGMAVIVAALWLPFGTNVGGDTDTWNIHANPEQYPLITPGALRTFQYIPERLGAWLTPDSFRGLNLLLIASVWMKGWLMYLLLVQIRPARAGFAFGAAALLILYPSCFYAYRPNMVEYQTSVALYLGAALLLVRYWQRRSAAALIGMLTLLVLALGLYETLIPLVLVTPLLLLWEARGWRPGLVRVSAIWSAAPLLQIAYTVFALATSDESARYQSGRIDLAPGRLGAQLWLSIGHVYGQLYWLGFRKGYEELIEHFGASPLFAGIALVAGLSVLAIGWILHGRSDRHAAPESPRSWLWLVAGGLGCTWIGYSAYFPTDLRLQIYRTLFYAAVAATIAVMAAVQLLAAACGGTRSRAGALVATLVPALLLVLSLGYSVRDMRAWQRHTQDEQKLLVGLFETLGTSVKDDSLIAVLETRDGRFARKFYAWFYQNAVRLILANPRVHVVLCFQESVHADHELTSCEVSASGLRVRNGVSLEADNWPWERVILLIHGSGGRFSLAEKVPGFKASTASYQPRALFREGAPLPPKLFTFLDHAEELVRRAEPR